MKLFEKKPLTPEEIERQALEAKAKADKLKAEKGAAKLKAEKEVCLLIKRIERILKIFLYLLFLIKQKQAAEVKAKAEKVKADQVTRTCYKITRNSQNLTRY